MKKKSFLRVVALLCVSFVLAACGGQSDFITETSKNLSAYEISAEFDAESVTLDAVQKLTYKNNTGRELNEIKFHLYPNAFRQDATIKPVAKQDETNAYPYGKSWGRIDVTIVKENGNPADFGIGGDDNNILTVSLSDTLFEGESTVIEISFIDYLPKCAHRYGYTDNNYSFGNWYPVVCAVVDGEWVTNPYYSNGDPFCSDMANYDVKVSYPKNLKIASTGNFTVSTSGDVSTMTANAVTVRDFAFVLSNKFNSVGGNVGNTYVQYFYFDDDNAKANLQVALDAVATFNDMIGEYPYASLCVVQTDFVYGGMEYPNLVYIASNLDATTQKQVIVHEIAHQWWYNLVGNDQVANAWMDEGLTEYTTALFFKANEQYKEEISYDNMIKTVQRNYNMFVDILSAISAKVDTTMTRATNEYGTEQEYVCMTYTKGLLMFENLAYSIGQSKFEKCLKRYYKDCRGTIATPQNMIDCFEKASGITLSQFFSNWLDGKVVMGG